VIIRSALVSLLATLVALLIYALLLGSYSSYPTADAAELAGIAMADQAAWMASNIKIIDGVDYALFLMKDGPARAAFLGGGAILFLFGFVCAFLGARFNVRRAVA
jgi:hypothetical protein